MVAIASSPEQITAEWLTTALQESGYLSEGRVITAAYKIIGTGKMGDNARYTLGYDG